MAKTNWLLILLLLVLLGTSIGWAPGSSNKKADNQRESSVETPQLAADLAAARRARIFFSHQSVGINILEGIKRLEVAYSGEVLRVAACC